MSSKRCYTQMRSASKTHTRTLTHGLMNELYPMANRLNMQTQKRKQQQCQKQYEQVIKKFPNNKGEKKRRKSATLTTTERYRKRIYVPTQEKTVFFEHLKLMKIMNIECLIQYKYSTQTTRTTIQWNNTKTHTYIQSQSLCLCICLHI